MRKLAKLTHQEKIDILSNAIRSKCRYGITSQRLKLITERLNLNRVYFIKSTRNRGKFLNYVTEEFVSSINKQTISYSILLYGEFVCGHFYMDERSKISVPGIMDGNHDAAALKMTISRIQNETPSITYTIVVYESGRKAVSI